MRAVSEQGVKQAGFTLLELLLVISLLAVVAFTSAVNYTGVLEGGDTRLVYSEIQELAKAIRQFKQDTGYYPKEGPFNLAIDGGAITDDMLPEYIGAASPALNDEQKRRWFHSPANFYQLLDLKSPLDDENDATTDHMLKQWEVETGRGWRGQYLSGIRDGYVDIGDGINNGLDTSVNDQNISPVRGEPIPDVIGVADAFDHGHVSGGDATVGNDYFDWSANRRRMDSELAADVPGRVSLKRWGRPYLFLKIDEKWALLSMGSNGKFDRGEEDDIVLFIE